MGNIVDANKIVGVHPVSNTGSIVVHEIDHMDDRVLVSLNGQNPEWCEITEMESDQEAQFGFKWGEMFVPFSEVMRI